MNNELSFKENKKTRNSLFVLLNSNAFTIAEVLVAIAIIAILGVIMVAIFASTLRGSNKSRILAAVKQNGQAVLENMDKTIRGADNVICVSPDKYTLVIEKAGSYTRFTFTPPPPSMGINGLIWVDYPAPSGTTDIQTFLASVCTPPSLGNPTALTDTNTQSGVSMVDGSFTRSRQAGSKDSVTVEFTLRPGIKAPAAVTGQIDPVKFQTSIQLR